MCACAVLCRYRRVQDLESRLVTCMVTLQGFTTEEAKRNPFSGTGVPMLTTDPFRA